MNGIIKWIIIACFASVFYQYRYKLLNGLLSNFTVRRMVVRAAMSLPWLRSKFLGAAFR
ncbi:hypothetical protein [Rossellomorea vietnamensis]|uniref:hypothetical protein n=1 Tax=Rossellomorea vietnamensis TaxID=218284 RepID=UPI00165396D5|nr:hypothetical protein [Rossellomorea vietnamensis]